MYEATLNIGWTLLLATVSLLSFYWYLRKPRGLPPGPWGVPFLGYWPFVGKLPHVTFFHLAKKYGPIFHLYLGNRLVIVLNNYDVVKEAFVNQADTFAGRPPLNMTIASYNKFNLLGSDGEMWKDQHRFIAKLLTELGVGKMSIEPQVIDEVQHFVHELEAFNGEPTNFFSLLSQSVLNNVNILIFGHRFEYRDSWLTETASLLSDMMSQGKTVGILVLYPWLKKIPGIAKILKQHNLVERKANIFTNISNTLVERKKTPEDFKRDNFINAFLLEQHVREAKPNNFPFPDEALKENIFTLMAGGMDSTATYLSWITLYMAAYPEVQAKVQREIDEVIGTDRTPCFNDRLRMPYTEATILEVQRMETSGPTAIPHRCMKETDLMGHRIPKDAIVLCNFWAVNNDEEFWEDPNTFRPERFLTPNGKKDKKEYIIPFSMGKRECIGKNLAKLELFLYFTSMLQKFTIKSESGYGPPNLERIQGMAVKPRHFRPRVVPRFPK